ncbi:MAG TPA: sigma-70 family RNA polymerase sigma factor [Terriglobales bacterium]|nr:sigma-70 family RNA polymerase sigma factor [Terriglobales bacterium]
MTNTLSDEELMLLVRDGAGEMLGVLFGRYQSPLFNFYCKLTSNRALSEDLVQDVFYRILKYRSTYRADTSFRAWMYQIARNARVDHARKYRPEEEFTPEMSPSVSPGDPVQTERETELLHRALQTLSDDKREVLVLSRFQEMKYEEIAQVMGCEVNTVKVRVFRALQDLREAYGRLERRGSMPGAQPQQGFGS